MAWMAYPSQIRRDALPKRSHMQSRPKTRDLLIGIKLLGLLVYLESLSPRGSDWSAGKEKEENMPRNGI